MGSTFQSTVINASADKVWQTIRDFHDMSWASGVITKCVPVGNLKGNQIGARRILNDAFEETLLEVNDGDRRLFYSIDDGPEPVGATSDYKGLISVRPVTDGDQAYVEWSSTWSGLDAETEAFCAPLYVAILADLKSRFD